jgi:uncharacterized protein YbaR (Trm112 family)
MTVYVVWIISGNHKKTKEQNRVIPIFKELYTKLLKEMHIRREIPLLLVDEASWNNKKGLNMNSKSIAHYNEGIQIDRGMKFEAVLLREVVLGWEDAQTVIPRLIRHELVHAKIRKKETDDNEHAEPFKKMAKRYKGVAMPEDY